MINSMLKAMIIDHALDVLEKMVIN